ncbi:hypothetical protein V1515DRAFT_609212, partial [Lipomyces mesembrius]
MLGSQDTRKIIGYDGYSRQWYFVFLNSFSDIFDFYPIINSQLILYYFFLFLTLCIMIMRCFIWMVYSIREEVR